MNFISKIPEPFHRNILVCEVFLSLSKRKADKKVRSLKTIERKLNKPIAELSMNELNLFQDNMPGIEFRHILDEDYMLVYKQGVWEAVRSYKVNS